MSRKEERKDQSYVGLKSIRGAPLRALDRSSTHSHLDDTLFEKTINNNKLMISLTMIPLMNRTVRKIFRLRLVELLGILAE